MADNIRTQVKAAIKRASAKARNQANRLDRKALDELTQLYRAASDRISNEIRNRADSDGTLRLEVLQVMLDQVDGYLDALSEARNQLLDDRMVDAAMLGVTPFAEDVARTGVALTQVAHDAVRQVQSFVAADGLQLSDRIWRLDNHAKQAVSDAIQSAVISGQDAANAALDFVSSGQGIPADLRERIANGKADRVARMAASALMRNEGSPYQNALRVFRTEINRAHGTAYQAAAFEHPDVVGTRFLLSPNHPRVDICDMHAKANLYGLGPGVYPKGKSPWPAHPNTLSYEEVVFADEVTDEDRAGKTDRIAWLKAQSSTRQNQILGNSKGWLLRKGLLPANGIGTPWRVLKRRLERSGIKIPETAANAVQPLPREHSEGKPWSRQAQHADWHESSFADQSIVYEAIRRHDGELKRAYTRPNGGSYYVPGLFEIHMSRDALDNRKTSRHHQGTWRHEYGHFLDNVMGNQLDTPLMFRSSADDFAGPLFEETRELQTLSGFGRKSKKQAAILADNAAAVAAARERVISAQSSSARQRVLDEMAQDIGMSLDDVETGLRLDTMIKFGTQEGDAVTAMLLTAAKRRDVYNLMRALTTTDESGFSASRQLYRKGMIGKFSDLLGSASKNKLAGHSGWGLGGHPTSYYKDRSDQTTEVFANYTALLGTRERFWERLLDHLLPATTQRYREIISHE
jgi:hypothetical protein